MGLLAGEQFIQNRAESIDVGPVIHGLLATRLFGRQIRRRAQDGSGARFGAFDRLQLGHAEVEHLDHIGSVVAAADEQILRVQIAVNDPGLVRGPYPVASLHNQIRGARYGQALAAIDEGAQAFAGQVFHHDVGRAVLGDAEVDGGGDVLAFESARGLGLALEPRQALTLRGQFGVQQLDREAALDHRVLRLVHVPHATRGKVANQPILAPDDLANLLVLGRAYHLRGPSWPRMASRSTAWLSIMR